MKRAVFILIAIISLVHLTAADVIVLKSGKKVAGAVNKKEDGYELKNEDGQLIGFALDEVEKIVTKPEELTADADKLFDSAKKLYNEALKLEDLKERNPLYHEGLEKLGKARDIYIEVRDLFSTERTLYTDKSLQDTMQLVKLFRERLVTEEDMAASVRSNVPSKSAKEPEEVKAETKEPEPESEAKVDVKKAEPAVEVKAEAKEPAPDITSAVLIVSDIKKLSDENSRMEAREKTAEMLAYEEKLPLKNFAQSLDIFLGDDLYSWGFLQDTLNLRGPNYENTFIGKVTRKDKNGVTMRTNQGDIRMILNAAGNSVTLTNGSNVKLEDYKLEEGKESKALDLLQSYFKQANIQNIAHFGADEHISAAKILAKASSDVGTENSSGLLLLACGHLSAAISAGADESRMNHIVNMLGLEKAYFNWGKPLWLTLNDARWSMLTEDYDSGSALIDVTYKDKKDFTPRYVSAYLKIASAISKKSGFDKTSASLKTLAKDAPNSKAKEHLELLAKSLEKVMPCAKCDGTGLLKCYKCKGKGAAFMKKCPVCKGLGEISIISSGGVRRVSNCKLCKTTGVGVNIPCDLCGGEIPPLKCAECGGEGFKSRVTLKGTRQVDKCERCGGLAVNPKFIEELKPGTGFVQCYKCKGKNTTPPTLEDVISQDICDKCNGLGFPIPKVAYPCKKCFGLGILIAPSSDPSKKLAD
ncbi:hypothetical protein HY605_05740 [Candidatus Peregrinibacteria bacterium]|nr:hypothetical protein [Candidatus Peregrinibacteria bacterium]